MYVLYGVLCTVSALLQTAVLTASSLARSCHLNLCMLYLGSTLFFPEFITEEGRSACRFDAQHAVCWGVVPLLCACSGTYRLAVYICGCVAHVHLADARQRFCVGHYMYCATVHILCDKAADNIWLLQQGGRA